MDLHLRHSASTFGQISLLRTDTAVWYISGTHHSETLTYQGFVGKVDASGVLQWYVETEETHLHYWMPPVGRLLYVAMGVCTDPRCHLACTLPTTMKNGKESDSSKRRGAWHLFFRSFSMLR
jgi:hypothetical protein